MKAEQLTIKFKEFENTKKEVSIYEEQEADIKEKRSHVDEGKKIEQLLPLYIHGCKN